MASIEDFLVPEGQEAGQGPIGGIEDFLVPDGQEADIQEPQEEVSFGDDILRQLGLTARAVGEGGAGAIGIVYNPIAELLNLGLDDESKIAPLHRQVSELLTQAGIPEPENAAERIVQTASQALVGGGGTVAVARGAGRVATSQIGRETSRQLAAQPTAQLAGAGASGASGQAAAEAGAGPVGQVAASLAGGVGGARISSPRKVDQLATSAQRGSLAEDIALGEDVGVRTLTSDIISPDTFTSKAVQRVGERVPIAGTGGTRAAQQSERVQAVKDLGNRFGAENIDDLSADIVEDLIKGRQAELTKWTGNKTASLNSAPGVVPVNNTLNKIDEGVAELEAIGTRSVQPLIARMKDWRNQLQGKDLHVVDSIRKELGEVFNDPDLAGAKAVGDKIVKSLYGPIKTDMGNHIKAVGGQNNFNKWNVANASLKKMIGEIDRNSLKSVLRKGGAEPETVERMLFSKKRSDVKALFKGLSEEGRSRARSAIIGKAIKDKNFDLDVSPERFVQQITALGKSTGVFFSGKDKQAINGLVRVLRNTRRASEASLAPPTGIQGGQLATGLTMGGAGGVLGGLPGVGAAAGFAGSAGLAARAYESAPVRNLLVRMAKVKIGSKEEAALMKRIIATAQQAQEN